MERALLLLYLSPADSSFLPRGQNAPPLCLILKKVHSWGGVTEMVHGLFLLVL